MHYQLKQYNHNRRITDLLLAIAVISGLMVPFLRDLGSSYSLATDWEVNRFAFSTSNGRFASLFDLIQQISFSILLLRAISKSRKANWLVISCSVFGLIIYEFSFGVNKNEVTYENLTVYRSKQPSLLYDRSSINGEQSIKFGSTFTGAKKQLWDITRNNSLFLSAAAAAGSDVIQPAFAALANDINLYDATHYLAELATIKKLFINDDARAQMLSQLIKYADIGIDGMDVRQSEGVMGLKDSLIGLDEIPEEARNKIAEDFKWSFAYDLFFHHKGSGDGFWLDSAHESEGTKAALAFFSVALRSLSSGATTVIDELDSSLHPTLLRDFVSLFADPDTNPKGAQLIFSTHDVTLMTRTSPMEAVLERDQVWFVEKDSEGDSQLIAAMEYSPRANENLGRNYLNGVYVPLPNPSFHQLVAQLMKEGADING